MSKPNIEKFKYPNSFKEMPLGPCAKSAILTEPNSGWRIMKPVINKDKCIKCLKCWLICPDGVIDKEGEILKIDYNFCKGCGICSYECPADAIEMVKEG